GGVGMQGRGAAFDPSAGSWRSLPQAPTEGRFRHAAVWTGDEMIVWGGHDGYGEPLATGAAYDPVSDSWRELPPAPISGRDSPVAVWTGVEMIVWGGFDYREGGLGDGAAYDPASDTWREIPAPPVSAVLGDTTVAWNGREMVVVSGAGELAMYSPAEDAWMKLPDPPAGRVLHPTLVSQGGEVILWGGTYWKGVKSDNPSFSSEGALLSFSTGNDEKESEDRAQREAELTDRERDTCSMDEVMCVALDRPSSIVGAGFGTAWVGNIGEGKTFGIARFDAETGDEVARLHADGFIQGFASDERWMWALLEGGGDHLTLVKIDPQKTKVADEFDMGSAGNISTASVVTGGGYVWISGPAGLLTRLSAVGGERETYTLGDALPGYNADNGPLYMAYGEDRLWLSYGLGHVGVVDPASGQLVRIVKDALGINAYNIAAAAGYLWSSHQSVHGDNVLSYTPMDGSEQERGRIQLEAAIPGPVASEGDRVWVVQEGFEDNDPGWLIEVDAETRQRVGEPIELDVAFQGTVSFGDGYVWVTGNHLLYRVTP
ncbi:MAG: Kelch repeat-containing protein, partial [Actinomycetota bacterium]